MMNLTYPNLSLRKLTAALLALGALQGLALPASAKDDAKTMFGLVEQEKQKTNIYKAYYPDLKTAHRAAISFHANLMEANYQNGYLIMELEAKEIKALEKFGFTFKPATEFIAKRNAMLDRLHAPGAKGALLGKQAEGFVGDETLIPNYPCYETVEETFAAAQGWATNYPALASWTAVGQSWEKSQNLGGYDMGVLKLTNTAISGDKPKLFINAAIHAREYVTAPLALAFAKQLVEGYGVNSDFTWILDHHEVHLMLQTNPDGRKKAEAGLSWRKNTNQNYCGPTSNSRGADLNRNFTQNWNVTNGQGSSGVPCDLTYRGPSAGSEPETQAVETYVRGIWPDRRGPNQGDPAPSDTSGIHIDLHSYSQLVLWPWGTTSTPAPNGAALQTLGRRIAWFNSYTPEQSIGLYPTDGTSDAVSYGELGVAAFTIEMGTSFFQSCTSYNSTIKPKNLSALVYAAKVVRTPYLTPAGPDVTTVSLTPNAATTPVAAGTIVTLTGSATDTRFRQTNGTEPTQAIAAAEYYIDVPPWNPGALAFALSPSDGNFNKATEGLTGAINTGGLASGRHIVFVRSKDASGAWGPFSSTFLRIQ